MVQGTQLAISDSGGQRPIHIALRLGKNKMQCFGSSRIASFGQKDRAESRGVDRIRDIMGQGRREEEDGMRERREDSKESGHHLDDNTEIQCANRMAFVSMG